MDELADLDLHGSLSGCRIRPAGAQCARTLEDLNATMSKMSAREKRLLPGWLRLILIVWGIALLLLLLQQLTLGLFSLFVG